MTGFDTPNTGTWQFDGKDMAHVNPEKVARGGMVRTFQLTKVMSRLTVLDNMMLGAQSHPGEGMFRSLFPGAWKKQEKENREKAEALLDRFLLYRRRTTTPGRSPAASASSSKWPVRSCATRSSSCSTSRWPA